jgi:hypothetical protein
MQLVPLYTMGVSTHVSNTTKGYDVVTAGRRTLVGTTFVCVVFFLAGYPRRAINRILSCIKVKCSR